VLSDLSGFVFDLDGCVWSGNVLNPGARDTLAALHAAGRRLGFISNNSRATGAELCERLHGLGVDVARPEHALTPLDIIGRVIADAHGPSRVLVMGAEVLAQAVARGGHEILDMKRYRDADVVVVGNDFDLSYDRLTAAARAAAVGAPIFTPNIDPRLPIENGDFLPGCGAIVQAVSVAAGRSVTIVGKPEPPLFTIALERLGLEAAGAAMVGDSVASDIRGGHALGMRTVLYAPGDAQGAAEADVVVTSFVELAQLAGVEISSQKK
jgi:4-nitrophenyl phosphatase